MSTLDPLLSVAAAIAATDTAVADASLNLGVAAEVVQAQLQVGDLLAAIVLAPVGGNDLLSIFGQTVVAQLPPGVHPGETLLLQVTAFQGNQVLVRNLGVADPQNPPTTAQLVLPAPAEGAPQTATLTTIPESVASDAATSRAVPLGAQSPAAPLPAGPIAPSSAVFVAASVQPAVLDSSASPVRVGSSQPAAQPSAVQTSPELEARILAARTTPPDRVIARGAFPETAPNASATTPRTAGSMAPMRSDPKLAVSVSEPGTIKAMDQPVGAVASKAAPSPTLSRPPLDTPIPPTSGADRLLAQLRVPATPMTLAAAKLVADSATAVPRALVQLESVLARMTLPISAPLRSMVSFIARLDPSNERALPEQIAAYVGNVLDGGESKLVALLGALARSNPQNEPPAPAQAMQATAPGTQATATVAQPFQAPGNPAVAILAAELPGSQARAVERAVSIESDLKTVLLALTQSTTEGAPPALASAVNDALVAITAAQLNVLLTNANDASAMSIAIPVFFREGGRAAQIRIARDAPGRKSKLDADNFHIGFVLDTQSLGTVAIDLETVGRSVKLDVKTEQTHAANRFSDALGELRTRLEGLRYRVASARAGVLASTNARSLPEVTPAASLPEAIAPSDRWDIKA